MDVSREVSKCFSSVGYIVAASYLLALLIFVGYTASLRTSERRSFLCRSSPDSRDDCLVKYDEQYNSPFPLYSFVIVCFVPLLAVCIAYYCIVKSRVDELEAALKPDPENPRPRPRVTTRRVFSYYFLHLLVRFVLGILFTVLQNFVFYPSGFPTEFVCVSPTVKPAVNSTDFNTTKDDGAVVINCFNFVGSDYANCAKGIWIVNILFAFLVFGEMCYLSVRALKSVEFPYDSEFCQKHFSNRWLRGTGNRGITLRMKRRMLLDTELLEPLVADQPESKTALDNIFVDLVIYTGRAEHVFKDSLKRHEIFDIYLKPQPGSIAIKKLDELFLPHRDTEDPRQILIVGLPGVGKSLLCTKMSRDWSKGDHDSYKRFEHLFLFRFRWFNTETMEMISLKQLLSLLYPEGSINSEVFHDMLDNPEKVLLVFDGLDEFKHHKRCLVDERAQGGNSATEEMPFSTLYVQLVEGKQLSGATVLTTCRPNVVQSVARLEFDRTVEIMGFTPEKVQEYVKRFFADPETANRIWGHISDNLELLSLCYIPVNSFIVCSFLEELIKLHEEETSSTLPTTLTKVCEGALRLFLFKHHPEFKGKPLTKYYLMENVGFSYAVEETLCQVGSLAKTGINEGRLVFDSTEVKGMEDCGLFNRMPDSQVSPFQWRANFCFIHLILQEFLAAREIAKMDPSYLSDFITSNATDPKWHQVIQFVAGLLCGKESEAAVNSFVSLLHGSLTEEPPLDGETKQKALLMMKCLHEYNNETTVEKAASELQKNSKFNNRIDLSGCQVTSAECTAVVYFIKHLHELTELDLGDNNITAKGASHLCDALKDVNYCNLTKLDLSYNNITDQGVSHLCDAVKDVNCKFTTLDLSGNNITDQGVSHLCDALKDENCKLTQLDLIRNNMTDQGVSHLCDALKDENCKFNKLDLSFSNITDQGVSHLGDALKDVNCKLTTMDLRGNNITEQGVSHLCDALKHSNCKLT